MEIRAYRNSREYLILKVLIVDDNKVRNKQIRKLLGKECSLIEEDILDCDNAHKAKLIMRSTYVDILILDIMIPRLDETASAKVGLDLLEQVTRRATIKTPGRVLGITANIDDIKSYQHVFEQYFFSVIEATSTTFAWKNKIVQAVNYSLKTSIAQSSENKSKLCFTIHGIESRGAWQVDLKTLINTYTDAIDFEEYKYGYFSFFSFLIPFMKEIAVNRFYKKLDFVIGSSKGKEIIVISHSFGTYIAVKGIEKYIKKKGRFNLRKLVLAGSVLPSRHDFKLILENTDSIIINETGDKDVPLLLSQLLVPNTGMAGRTGFYGFNNKRFFNRYFCGGHSHYFDSDENFMEKYWLPLINDYSKPELIDLRQDSLFNKSIEFIVNLLGKFKEFTYFLLIALLAYKCFL